MPAVSPGISLVYAAPRVFSHALAAPDPHACRNLRIREVGTLMHVEAQASDLRGHWAHKAWDGVGSALILRLRQNSHPAPPGQRIAPGSRCPGPRLRLVQSYAGEAWSSTLEAEDVCASCGAKLDASKYANRAPICASRRAKTARHHRPYSDGGRRSSRVWAAARSGSSSWVMSRTTAPARALSLTARAIDSRWRRSTPELGSS